MFYEITSTEINTLSLHDALPISFKDKKLDEKFLVYKNFAIIPLDKEELNYFENYITSIISPKIFEFFFFDGEDRKSTRLNSSHVSISYAVFCLKKKKLLLKLHEL